MDILIDEPSAARPEDLPEIARLLGAVFEKDRKWEAELPWQYVRNPCGPAHYVNARLPSGKLVGHYAVIPVPPFQDRRFQHLRTFLSLNTAVHPEAQGKGVFKLTASRLYTHLKSAHPSVVLGVANAKSVKGLVGSLGFTGLGQLCLRFFLPWQVPRVGRPRLLEAGLDYLRWRSQRPSCLCRATPETGSLSRIIRHRGIPLEGVLSTALPPELLSQLPSEQRFGKRLFGPLKLYAGSGQVDGGMPVPARLRPSPLHFIARMLSDESSTLLLDHIRSSLFEFLDFDVL